MTWTRHKHLVGCLSCPVPCVINAYVCEWANFAYIFILNLCFVHVRVGWWIWGGLLTGGKASEVQSASSCREPPPKHSLTLPRQAHQPPSPSLSCLNYPLSSNHCCVQLEALNQSKHTHIHSNPWVGETWISVGQNSNGNVFIFN